MCPSQNELEQFNRGELAREQAHALSEHLEQCEVCWNQYDLLPHTELVDGLPLAVASPSARTWEQWIRKRCVPHSPVPDEQKPCIEGYSILGKLGEGGFGIVYLGQAEDDQAMIVAIKVIPATFSNAANEIETAERESKRAEVVGSSERCHHVVRVYETGQCENRDWYIVMELALAGTLADRLPVPGAQAARLLEPIARAVGSMHAENRVHRDLKPKNILLNVRVGSPEPDDGTRAPLEDLDAFLSDFGLARKADDHGHERTRDLIGTDDYHAPEQLRDGKHASPATDVYALGVILYEMLAGQKPFQGRSHQDLLDVIRSGFPLRPTKLDADLSPALEAICFRCLQKNPNHRYQNGYELAADLRRFLAPAPNDPVQATRPGWLMWEGRRWLGKHPIAAVLLPAALAVGVLFGLLGWRNSIDRANKLEAENRAVLQVADYIAQAEEAIGQAKKAQPHEITPWEKAAIPLSQTKDLVEHTGDRKDDLQQKIQAHETVVEQNRARAENRRQMNECLRKDLRDARLATVESFDPFTGKFDYEPSDRAFAAAFFRFLGKDLSKVPVDPADIENLRTNPDRAELAASLAEWMITHMKIAVVKNGFWIVFSPPPGCERLRKVAEQLADKSDPWERRFYEAFGTPWAAAKLLELSRDRNLSHVPTSSIVVLAEVMMDTNVKEGIEYLHRAKKEHPNDFWLNLHLSVAYLELEPSAVHKAVRYAAVAESQTSNDPASKTFLGVVEAKAGDTPAAIERLRDAIQNQREAAYARGVLIRLLIRQGKIAEAAKELKETPPSCLDHKAILLAKAELAKATGKNPPK